jgi:dolichol-phosphate mannosyltransferase
VVKTDTSRRRLVAVPSLPDANRDERPWLSILIPVCDEEACLSALWRRLLPVLESVGRPFEVLFVDDGSTDGSLDVLRGIRSSDRRVRLLCFERNRGQSAALAEGIHAARGAWIATLDADLQNPPEELPRLLEASIDVELVYGRRVARRDSFFRRLSSRVGNGVRNAITGHRVVDTGCSLKLFRADAARRLPMINAWHRFLPTLFEWYGFRTRELDVRHEVRVGGTSKYGVSDRAWRGLIDCLGMRWIKRRSLRSRAWEIGGD